MGARKSVEIFLACLFLVAYLKQASVSVSATQLENQRHQKRASKFDLLEEASLAPSQQLQEANRGQNLIRSVNPNPINSNSWLHQPSTLANFLYNQKRISLDQPEPAMVDLVGQANLLNVGDETMAGNSNVNKRSIWSLMDMMNSKEEKESNDKKSIEKAQREIKTIQSFLNELSLLDFRNNNNFDESSAGNGKQLTFLAEQSGDLRAPEATKKPATTDLSSVENLLKRTSVYSIIKPCLLNQISCGSRRITSQSAQLG